MNSITLLGDTQVFRRLRSDFSDVRPRAGAWIAVVQISAWLTGAILFLMWGPFFRLALEQSVAALGVGTIYSNAYLLLRETIWWWVASLLLALLFGVFLTAKAGDNSRRQPRDGIEGKVVTIPDLAGG